MITVLDIETTFTKDGDPTTFHPENKLVSVGINDQYFFFYHKDMKDMKKIQENMSKSASHTGDEFAEFDLIAINFCCAPKTETSIRFQSRNGNIQSFE